MSDRCQQVCGHWQDYLFLTKEIGKFLAQDNVGMILNLLEQRERLQEEIERVEDGEYRNSVEGQQFIRQVGKYNDMLRLHMEKLRNQIEKQQKIAVAYDGLIQGVRGNQMDQKG
ncbi:MAG: hypothetical protein H6Q74_2648 [Firmicutes bacterium]|nr:hypothetical protein [Bacillota bacterium]